VKKKILAISGSLRARSSNAALLRAAATLGSDDLAFTFCDEHLGALPLFNPDLDAEGAVAPPAVEEFRALLRAAEGVLICCPEYAHGVPGALKNALDWIVSSGELEGKPVALIVASPGGGDFARTALAATLEVMGAKLLASVSLTLGHGQIDENGTVSSPDVIAELERTVAALVTGI
jgi:NAD(P)H-dependent FMN reductase